MESLNFDKNGIGFQVETVVRKWLSEHDYMVLSASQIEDGGAPMLRGKEEKIILPDNLTWKNGVAKWVEVKTKSFATLHHNPPHRWEHGISLRLWYHYMAIQEKTQIPVYIALVQLDKKLLLLSKLTSLGRRARIGIDNHGKDMIYFNQLDKDNFSDFDEWYKIDEKLPDPIKPLAHRTKTQPDDPLIVQMKLDLLLDSEKGKLTTYFSSGE